MLMKLVKIFTISTLALALGMGTSFANDELGDGEAADLSQPVKTAPAKKVGKEKKAGPKKAIHKHKKRAAKKKKSKIKKS